MWEHFQPLIEEQCGPASPAGEQDPEALELDADGVQACPYRREAPAAGEGPGEVEVRCIAMGGALLGRKVRDLERVRSFCNACTVPRKADFRPCLYLVPFKTERDGQPRDYFACRWFYKLRPEGPATSTAWMCGGCPYWFPMPPLEVLGDLERKARFMIQFHQDFWANPPRGEHVFGRQAPPPPTSWLRRAVDRIRWAFV
jgi:hypothetical protein